MKKLLLALGVVFTLSAAAGAADIAFYVGEPNPGWYVNTTMRNDVTTIIDRTGKLFGDVQKFDDTQLADFGAWVDARMDDGKMDIIWLPGTIPSVLYQFPNVNADGSRAERWLDGGNMIINVGDWFAYCSYEVNGTRQADNGGTGAANILDLSSGIIVSADNTSLQVTPAGQQYMPSITSPIDSDRPIALSAVVAPWEVAAIFGSTGGTEALTESQADPVVLHNTVTGAYVALINQANPGFPDRGVVCAEFIGNWVAQVIGLGNPALASDPEPESEAVDVPQDVALNWEAGPYAVTHDVYLGTSFVDVNDATRASAAVLVSQGQTDTSYQPAALLDFGTTYYWRIDEVNKPSDNTTFQGETWSFTVEPYAYPVTPVAATASSAQVGMGPENTINGAGLTGDLHGVEPTTMWLSAGVKPNWIQYEFDKVYTLHELLVWNSNQLIEGFLGFGAKDVTIETSTDGTTWAPVADVPPFNQAPGAPDYAANTTVSLGDVEAKYVKLTINTNWGGVAPPTGLAEVRFFYVPVWARIPQPANGTTDVSIDTALNWRPGRGSTSHSVYFGTDGTAVANGTVAAQTVTDHRYSPAALNLATTYYWKVDEVGAATYPGDVWSFTTQPYGVVDDFESYTADPGAEVFSTWIDGFDNPAKNGAVVGLATAVGGTFCDTTLFHGGKASMPFAYDNTAAPLSEAVRTFDTAQDWTAHGVQSLLLWVRGAAGNTGQLYIKINGTKVAYDGDAGDLAKPTWMPWSIDLSAVGASLGKVTSLTIGVEGAAAKGSLNIDDIRLYPKLAQPGTTAGAIEIAISTQAGWWSQGAADTEMQKILQNVKAVPVRLFAATEQQALADWVVAHTGDGASDLLILCGQFPATIYAPGNAQADDSLAELFLDDGNCIINTGDYMFYVVNGAGTNAAGGLQTMMDIAGITMWDDDTAVVVTADGKKYTPSLQDYAVDRPWHLDELQGDWYAELILAQNAAGTRAEPAIIRNLVTGGRLGTFYQTSSQDGDPRGAVISEWINNWYLPTVALP
jgi:hypothetical protein